MRFLHPRRCAVAWLEDGAVMTQGGLKIEGMDVVLPRVGTSVTETGLVVLRHLEGLGVRTPNTAESIGRSRDKVASLQWLSHCGVPVPPSVFVDVPDQIEECAALLGGPPVVVKVVRGTQGVGVIKVGELDQLRATVEALWGLGEQVLVQRFVSEAQGRDLRLFVVGDEVAAAMERESAPGDFRSNLHRGGTARGFRPDQETAALAVKAAKALGLGIAGVDLLITQEGPVVLEVNSSPGLEGIEAATGKNLARVIVKHLESLMTRAKPEVAKEFQ